MAQLLAGEAREPVHQGAVLAVAKQQVQRRARGLFFAVGVICQQEIGLLERGVDPALGRRTAEKGANGLDIS